MATDDVMFELRRRKGFALFWWWRAFFSMGCWLKPVGSSSGVRYCLALALLRLASLR